MTPSIGSEPKQIHFTIEVLQPFLKDMKLAELFDIKVSLQMQVVHYIDKIIT